MLHSAVSRHGNLTTSRNKKERLQIAPQPLDLTLLSISHLRLRLHAARCIRPLARPDTTGRWHRRANWALGVLVVVAADDLLAPHDGQTLLAGDGLELHQRLRDGLELLAVGRQNLPGLLLALGDDTADLLIDEPRRLLGHVLALGDGVAEEDLLLVVDR